MAKDQGGVRALIFPLDVRRVRYKPYYMTLTRRFIFLACIAFVALATILSLRYSVHAAGPLSSDSSVLLARYPAIRTKLEENQFGIPLYLESREEYSSLHVDVYGIFDYPFDSVSYALLAPNNWCDINSLLINIKACTFRKVSDQWQLTLYSGRKYYQPPRDAYKLDFSFRIAAPQREYLDIALVAKNGPLFTTDHRIRCEAAPLDKGRTFIHFSYDYSYGVLARAALKTYFATIGRDKRGFSIIATAKNGDPVYVGGVRGSLERNAVRYYLAIQTYMDTLKISSNQRFEKRNSRWFDLTARFPRQLYELDKGVYLANKKREHNNQLILQIEAGK
jgi:hypothetical protein